MNQAALGTAVVACLLLAIAAVAAPALGAEGPTRDEYREAAEPICKANTKANERIFNGVRKQVEEGKLKAAAAKFATAATALQQARADLVGVPRPVADVGRLKRWLDHIEDEADYFGLVAGRLKSEDRRGASRLVTRLYQTANRANAVVLPFDFVYCRLEPARFT